jgi:hypothetical protein
MPMRPGNSGPAGVVTGGREGVESLGDGSVTVSLWPDPRSIDLARRLIQPLTSVEV